MLAGLRQKKETRTIKSQLSDKRKPANAREPRLSALDAEIKSPPPAPRVKKEVPSSPPVAHDVDFDFDMDDVDDAPAENPPSSPLKSAKIKTEEDDDDVLAPISLNVGKRTAVVNKTATKVLTPAAPKVKPPSSPVKMEEPDASEWQNINDTLLNMTEDSFQNVSKTHLSDVADENSNVKFFWTDYREFPDALTLFGKSRTNEGKYVSAFLFIPHFQRELYFLPRQKRFVNGAETDEEVGLAEVYEEVEKLMNKMGVEEWASKGEEKKYCFEIEGVPREATYLKVLYKYGRNNQLPMDTTGQTFSHVFGTNTNIFENFVLSRDIMGPCWLDVKNCSPIDQVSWCNLEIKASGPADITPIPENDAPPVPPMTLMSISLRTIMNKSLNKQEVVTISARIYPNVEHDTTTSADKLDSIAFTLTRPPTVKEGSYLVEREAEKNSRGQKTVWDLRTEEAVLSEFLNRMQKYDPDVIIGHSLENTHFNVLAHRIFDKKIQGWSRLGRYQQRGPMPSSMMRSGNFFAQRQLATGRLMCDISNVFGKSLTLKCNSWTLSEMCQVYLNQTRFDNPVDCSQISWIQDAKSLYNYISHNMIDTHFIAAIAIKLQMLPLSKQLTNIAGNSWAKTLLGTRAERNEYILLHQFHKQGYIVPDKGGNQKNAKGKGGAGEANEDEDEDAGTKKKDKYKGGLVFEPEKGLYDHIILVMDFNSLYPSIIQEYNICFTTVERNLSNEENPNEEEQPPDVPDSNLQMGIFPRLVQNLVQRRRAVKSNMKDPKATAAQKAQWDIKQQALKLTANSMYGCLGYVRSRFYARPLAVLTTFKGREILTNTKELAETNGLKVIYGDTDSVMINTNVDSYEDALKIGNDFKRQVNERYKLLEIDTDNVFRRMLLHAKKKYAAVNMSLVDGNIVTSMEVKGLDMKRREYCQLSKEASEFALSQILGDSSAEEALEQIHDHLRELAENVRENKIPLPKLIIRNKLGKRPDQYPNGNTMPHVQVAKRLGDAVKVDDVIAFIIAGDDAESQKHVAQRAYTLREFNASGGKLKPDPDYYLTKQILPPLERLCAPIEGTDAVRLAGCLGLDTEKYRLSHVTRTDGGSGGQDFMPFQSTIADAERFRDAAPLELKCICDNVFQFPGLSTSSGRRVTAEGIKCDGCTRTVTMTSVNAQLEAQIRKQIALYYSSWAVCDECHTRTRQIGVYGKRCIVVDSNRKQCLGVMALEYSDLRMYNQLLYFDSLFDVDKAKKRAEGKGMVKPEPAEDGSSSTDTLTELEVNALAEQNRVRFSVPRQVVEKYLARCGRRYVDMHNIFSFV